MLSLSVSTVWLQDLPRNYKLSIASDVSLYSQNKLAVIFPKRIGFAYSDSHIHNVYTKNIKILS